MKAAWLASALLGLVPSLAAQECDEARTRDLLRVGYPVAESSGNEPPVLLEGDTRLSLSAVCKVWPARPEFTLLAVQLEGPGDSVEGVSRGDLEVLVVSNGQDQVRYRHRESHVLDGDAIFVDRLELDTAPYRLSPGVLAFGVRVGRRNMSQPNPFHSSSLRLYAVDDASPGATGLRPLLRDLEMDSSAAEWDMQCAGQRGEASRTLAIDPARRHHGMADLLVRGKSLETTSVLVGAECVDRTVQTVATPFRLQFDGQAYRVPSALRGMDDDYAPGASD